MPIEKIIERYDKALAQVCDVVHVADVCHIYDNSTEQPFRIFKKRKSEEFFDVCVEWHQEYIKRLTGSENMQYKNLNK